MVIAQLVRVSNCTERSFRVKSRDIFYTPQADGVPCEGGAFEVPPGFNQQFDGLVVPWSSATIDGLVITEGPADEPIEVVRCVVGPTGRVLGSDDWLQFRSRYWQNLAEERWIQLGRRHALGVIGAVVELMLTFRDCRVGGRGSPAAIHELIHFEEAVRAHEPNDVMLNVFDLASSVSLPNTLLCNSFFSSMGAFHAAVEVYGEEWSFYSTPNPRACGVIKSRRPRHHPVHVYKQSIHLGKTSLTHTEVISLIGLLAPDWLGGNYNLLERNCIHFSKELALSLGANPVPPWVSRLHETGASLFRPLSSGMGGVRDAAAPGKLAQYTNQVVEDVHSALDAGARMVEDTKMTLLRAHGLGKADDILQFRKQQQQAQGRKAIVSSSSSYAAQEARKPRRPSDGGDPTPAHPAAAKARPSGRDLLEKFIAYLHRQAKDGNILTYSFIALSAVMFYHSYTLGVTMIVLGLVARQLLKRVPGLLPSW